MWVVTRLNHLGIYGLEALVEVADGEGEEEKDEGEEERDVHMEEYVPHHEEQDVWDKVPNGIPISETWKQLENKLSKYLNLLLVS